MEKIDYLAGQLLLINKPLTWTSFDVVKKVRNGLRAYCGVKKIKVGHAGTLDPLATGLLIVCTGKFTKIIAEIQNQKKTYTGTITLGATTPSYDLETKLNYNYLTKHITEKLIHDTKSKFVGEINQTPPIFSALKKDGERLYEKARRGENLNIDSRKVHISLFNITYIDKLNVHFKIKCSKGTYIRSIANDFGISIGLNARF